MKHKVAGRKFSRVRKQRRALLKSLLNSFIIREKITTTEAKAKELKSIIDSFIKKAKKVDDKNKVSVIRNLRKTLSGVAVKKLTGEFVRKFDSRKSGYSKITKLGRRKGDSAKMAVIEFVS